MSSHPDATEFRRAAACFTTGVTVVGAIDTTTTAVGMTANSFVTVSASPPIVLVSLMPGRTLTAIAESGRYGVSVLASAALAATRHFSGSLIEGVVPQLVEERGFALLPDALAVFACEVSQTIPVADHTLLVGEVRWCRSSEGRPLSFFGSAFCAGPGDPISA